jgi:hypothetical protein
MNLSEILVLSLWQVFSPGKVVFAGVGVFLMVRILHNISAQPI